MLKRQIIPVALFLISIIVTGCTDDLVYDKRPPNLTVDSNVMTEIKAEWTHQAPGNDNVSVVDAGATVYSFFADGNNSREIIKFNTTDGKSHYCTVFFRYTNESPNMHEINDVPAYFYNITFD
jgi:hypothetical protein